MKCCIRKCKQKSMYLEWLPQFQATGGFCNDHWRKLNDGCIFVGNINPIIKKQHDKTMDIFASKYGVPK